MQINGATQWHRATPIRSLRLPRIRWSAPHRLMAAIGETFGQQRVMELELDQARSTLEETYMATLETLASAVDARDPNTYGHCRRVAELASMLGRETGMSQSELQTLVRAALLHDIGKLGVPDSTLWKTTPLTQEDSAALREHPDAGYRMLAGLRFLGEGLEAIRYHHERYDGNGYPFGLAGKEIPLMARILAVADAYDAITSDRPYRLGRPKTQGIQEIVRCSGTHFDPEVVTVFLRLFGTTASEVTAGRCPSFLAAS